VGHHVVRDVGLLQNVFAQIVLLNI
jgi:hypothetical protein